MVTIYDFSNYREYLATWIASQSKGGRGIKMQISKALKVSTTLTSFIFAGTKTLTLEQASNLADFIGLNDPETDFLFLLVELERAGTHSLRLKLERRLKVIAEQSKKVSSRVKKDLTLSDQQKAIYYSSWIFTGIRNLVATGEYRDAKSISERLNIPQGVVAKALQFLIENKLCIQDGVTLRPGPTYTHVDSDSPFVNKHRQNWRLRGFSMMEQKKESDLFYSSPMSLSRADAEKIRSILLGDIQKAVEIMRPSPSEEVFCLNIDWFEY